MAGLSFEHGTGSSADANRAFKKQLNKVYGWYTGGFLTFVIVLAIAAYLGHVGPALWLVLEAAWAELSLRRAFPLVNSFESRMEWQQLAL